MYYFMLFGTITTFPIISKLIRTVSYRYVYATLTHLIKFSRNFSEVTV